MLTYNTGAMVTSGRNPFMYDYKPHQTTNGETRIRSRTRRRDREGDTRNNGKEKC